MKKILAADIGGTNSRFAYFETDGRKELSLVTTKWLLTKDNNSFGNLIDNLGKTEFPLKPGDADIAVFAVAGPVEKEVYCSPPFISWDIDISNADKKYGLRSSFLINDFVAQAFACRSPVGETAEKILDGEIKFDATAAVLGAGTGLGKAALVPDNRGGFVAVPSEGGHAGFPFETEREFQFMEFMKKELKEDYVTGNYVVSGRGISYVHRFLTGEKLEPKDVSKCFIKKCETLEWSTRFYGRICRNFALETLAQGGVYIAGGVAAKAPLLLKNKTFEKEFRSSKTMGHILEKIPVYLITNEESGLWGSAMFGKQKLRKS
ncbi:MAG: glucokinase [Thermodesulfovibrionales bacterium]